MQPQQTPATLQLSQPQQQQPTAAARMLPVTPSTPSTPDSTSMLISTAAANAANEKRNKTIMNCFRDRSSNFSRSNSRVYNRSERNVVGGGQIEPQSQQQQPQQQLPETTIYLKEPRMRTNILTLLKSSSTRDLSHLMEEEPCGSNTNTSSSCSSATSWELQSKMKPGTIERCSNNCKRQIKQLEERVTTLEQDLSDQRAITAELEAKLQQLSQRFEEMVDTKAVKRKKSVNTRKKSSATNGGNVQPSKLVAWMNLSNLWKHRPSIETLKEQNIYNDEPCFDTEIEVVLKHEARKTIPKIVVDCCDLIEDKYRKSSSPIEGIYRQCGDYNRIQTLRFQIDANDYAALRQPSVDIHTLTGVLKLFLREIKSPLVSTNEANTFIGKPNQWVLTELPAKIDILRRLIRSLPEVNRDTMDYLFLHFNKLTKVPLQQVSAETLSLSVTPSIFHTVQEGVHIQDIHILLKESEVLADCVKIMIEYHNRIFECAGVEWRQRISVRRLKKTLSHPDLLFQNMF